MDIFCRLISYDDNYIEAILLDDNFNKVSNIKIQNNNLSLINDTIFKFRGIWKGKTFVPKLYRKMEEAIIIPQSNNEEVYFRSLTSEIKGKIKLKNKKSSLKPFSRYYCISNIEETEKGNLLNIVFIKEVSSMEILTKKALKIRKNINLALSKCSSDTFEDFSVEMNNDSYFSNSRYKVLGYWDGDIFKSVQAKEIIKAKIRIINVVRHNKETFNAYCKAEFLNYPMNKKPPTREVFISGTFASIFKNDDFLVEGFWERTKTNIIFKVLESERVFGDDEKTISSFLRLALRGTGVGKVTIARIMDEFKIDTLNIIEKDYLQLTKIKGITEDKAFSIHERVMESRYLNEIMAYLVQNSLDNSTIIKIFKRFGIKAISKIKENPYCIMEIQGIPFEIADLIAKNEGIGFSDKLRIKHGLLHFLKNKSEQNGDLFTYKDKIFENLEHFLKVKGSYSSEQFESIDKVLISDIIEELKFDKIIIEEKSINNPNLECIYLYYNNFIENNIVSRLKNIINNFRDPICSDSDIIDFIERYESKYKIKFAKKQKEAIRMALLNGVSILTGGPGTGKTHTINAIIKCIKELKKGAIVDLCAPTGKASKRMSEMTGEDAMTIHRRLKYIPFESENDLDVIDGDLLVVDEASMIDANLFLKLLENTEEDTRILFVGDHNQIPSVGAGSVFRDLIESGKIPMTILDEIFRQAEDSKIIVNSHKIIKGITTEKGLDLTNSEDFKFYRHENAIDIQDRILKVIQNKLDEGFKLNDIQVLTLMNQGDLGTHELNYRIQKKFNNVEDKIQISPIKVLNLGDRVMQLKNNYDLNVFNGSVGEVSKVSNKMEIEVNYDGEGILYEGEACDEIMLAYAMTIHKSQGSEFPIVIIPVHSSQAFMNNRNLIYTAITRAKKEVILIGSEKVLNEVILKIDSVKRNSQIIEKMKSTR